MTDELIEQVARALAKSHGLDFDEVCGVDADPDNGECDSGTCIAACYEDHDAAHARAMYRADARAALAAINLPARLEAARTQGWNEAFEAAAEQCELWANKLHLALKNAQARKQWQEARDLESMVMSAFRAFQTRALTKENSDG